MADMAFMAVVIRDYANRRMLEEHMDTVLWTIGRRMYADYPIEAFQKMTGKVKQDLRSGQEIVDDLAEKFRARIEAKRGEKR